MRRYKIRLYSIFRGICFNIVYYCALLPTNVFIVLSDAHVYLMVSLYIHINIYIYREREVILVYVPSYYKFMNLNKFYSFMWYSCALRYCLLHCSTLYTHVCCIAPPCTLVSAALLHPVHLCLLHCSTQYTHVCCIAMPCTPMSAALLHHVHPCLLHCSTLYTRVCCIALPFTPMSATAH